MGIFDQLTNLSPEQNQGLLAAAAQILQQSGPSRMPSSFGQILGGGLQAYQGGVGEAQKRKLEELLGQQTTQMNSYKLRDAESDYQNQEAMRQRAQQIQAGIAGLGGIGGQPSQQTAQAMPEMPLGSTPQASTPGAPSFAQPPAPSNNRVSKTEQYAQRLLDEAAVYSQYGDSDGADKRYQAAIKLLPQVQNIEAARDPSGKLVNVITFKDGSQKVSEFGVKPDFKVIDQGGTQTIADLNAAQNGQSYTKTATPGELLSAATTRRGQDMTNTRAREEIAAGGKPPPGYRWTPDGTLAAIPGGPGDKLPESQQKQVVGVNNLSNAIQEYRSQLDKFGGADILRPDARAVMGTKYNNMMLQAKEAYNLGVLNGPDFEILQSVITDPRSVKGALTSKTALDTQASELERIMQGVGAVSSQARQPQQSNRGGVEKIISLADIAETARKSGKTTAEVTAAARANGYKIGGQ